jgi:hypothetical protein
MQEPGEEFQPTAVFLVCAECGAVSPPDATSWRAYLDIDGEAVTFCPECAEREFGDGLVVEAFQEPGEASKRGRQKDTA